MLLHPGSLDAGITIEVRRRRLSWLVRLDEVHTAIAAEPLSVIVLSPASGTSLKFLHYLSMILVQ
jgi:hypothetical protein